MAFQPSLFPDFEVHYPTAIVDAKVSSKALLRHLYAVRRLNNESVFIPALNNLIDKVRNFINLSDTQIEETVLYAIEVQMAYEITEIVEDTNYERKTVESLLLAMKEKGLVRCVPKHIPGSDRQYFIWKSNRQDIQEMGDL